MKVTLFATFVALLMAGCGGENAEEKEKPEAAERKKPEAAERKKAEEIMVAAKDDPSIPDGIDCSSCGEAVSKYVDKCLKCGHPAARSITAYREKVKRLAAEAKRRAEEEAAAAKSRAEEEAAAAKRRAEEERKRAEEERMRAEKERRRLEEIVKMFSKWEANPEPYGGLEALAEIRKATESNATELRLNNNRITDLTPLAGLTKLESLHLFHNKITDVTPLAGLTNLEWLYLGRNKITDASPLAGLTNLKELQLSYNHFHNLPADQKIAQEEMLRKALPNCKIKF